jgi:membrane-bound lytic murein transglycosylase A
MKAVHFFLFLVFGFALMLEGCAGLSLSKKQSDKNVMPDLRLMKVDVPNVQPNLAFFTAFSKSCQAIMNKAVDASYGPNELGGHVSDWSPACQAVENNTALNAEFLRTYFNSYRVFEGHKEEGLFTGYYEPLLRGSYEKTDTYKYPLYMRPSDLIEVNLGDFRDNLKGERIAGRVIDGRLKPFEDRSEIDAGQLSAKDLELVWVDSKVDAFFLHIQGSGVIEFTDGTRRRIGYAAQNGHVYYAVGRALIDWGEVAKEDMSLQAIKQWLDNNPARADELLQLNPSYVFFRWIDGDGPLGAQGVALTPEHSLAVDRRLIAYGSPVLIMAEHPNDSTERFVKMMVAQDTGGAIRGAVRGDVFWGAGRYAEEMAGKMKSKGSYTLFLPKTIEVPEKYIYKASLWSNLKGRIFNE